MKYIAFILLLCRLGIGTSVEKCFFDVLFKSDTDYKLMTDLLVMKKMLMDFHLLPEKI